VHIDDDALSASIRRAAATAGFSALRPVIEVRGKCRECH
jgi:Fur family zinc uptake transcriptional regulator